MLKENNQTAAFKLGAEFYVFSITGVREIIKITEVSVMPRMPEYTESMQNIGGGVYTAYNMRRRFKKGDSIIDEGTKIILFNDIKIALIVDEVSELIELKQENIETKAYIPLEIRKDLQDSCVKIHNSITIVANMGT